MSRGRALALVLAVAVLAAPAEGGHELPIYPSFYPSEIVVDTTDPGAAARRLGAGEMHAYVGAEPDFAGPPGKHLATIATLGALVLVSVDPPDCPALASALRDFADHPAGAVFHPFPVTSYHADYLQHADQAEAAERRVREAPPGAGKGRIERVDAAALVADTTLHGNGWIGPPWLKFGWFQAYRLLSDALPPAERGRADAIVQRLEHNDFASLEERLDGERGLLSLLTGNCRRAVAGYTVKHEWYNADYSAGIENIAADSMAGLDAPVFIRTVKLKDFPWNGRLVLGVPSRPAAAWNPAAGFGDPAGRLIWAALGDPAAFPSPYGEGWVLNRIADVTPLP
jgi:hypothetical protein